MAEKGADKKTRCQEQLIVHTVEAFLRRSAASASGKALAATAIFAPFGAKIATKPV
jgi:hypothetical protein